MLHEPEVRQAAGNIIKSTILKGFLLHTAVLPTYPFPPTTNFIALFVMLIAIPMSRPGVQKRRTVKRESLINI